MTELLKRVEGIVGRVTESVAARKAVLISPDGVTYDKSALDPEQDLTCALFQESREMDYVSQGLDGVDITSERPVAVFRRRSLERIPQDGETWLIRIDSGPFGESGSFVSYALSGPPKTGFSVGFINLRLRRVSQA